MLTTEDNPFDPWTQYDLWREWDISHGYNLESYIATLMPMLTSASIEDYEHAWSVAVSSILEQNIFGNLKLVPKPADYEEDLTFLEDSEDDIKI
jgi:hypothetical protein|nr:MAG TPA: hypothetical protein [Caudoviricetes sp.]DAR94812.1 MAG TPA: hypothetical protein [Caudoviricetes sp.]DAW05954.1 MAG TPA: hypothetical protein [Caudoviricetes sp.]DAY04134.1 MAG TPA: hypothetical protein [Caudoviricetes sp.]